MIKYVLHPGDVVSKKDGQVHFISADRLTRLYRVKPSECIMIDVRRPETYFGRHNLKKYIHLYPKYNGDYSIG